MSDLELTDLSYEAEEYIEAIYKLQKRDGMAKTKELAETLHVVPGSITNTIEHLESHGLVIHEPYRGVKLTAEGEKLALDILRRHRLAERLLTDILKAEWSNVHEDACKLEHAMTKNVASLVEKRLGYPKCCPHGNPIPTQNGLLIEEQPCITLNEANIAESYVVDRITDEEHTDLQLLAEKKIKPETTVQVLKRDAKSIVFSVEGKKHQLSSDSAANVLLRKIGRKNHAVST